MFRVTAGLSKFGVVLALVGGFLASGIMTYQAVANAVDYTLISWALIAPVWALLAALSLIAPQRRAAALPLGWLSIFAGVYYADVFALYPAAGLLLLSAFSLFAPRRGAQAGMSA